MTKAQIVQAGLALGADYGLTSSCYDPSAAGQPCGQCDSCLLRLKVRRGRFGGSTCVSGGLMSYTVKEIFYTLQGEGFHTGRPAVFCRFASCNLWTGRENSDRHRAICTFCDTDFVGTDGVGGGHFGSAEELVDAVGADLAGRKLREPMWCAPAASRYCSWTVSLSRNCIGVASTLRLKPTEHAQPPTASTGYA